MIDYKKKQLSHTLWLFHEFGAICHCATFWDLTVGTVGHIYRFTFT